MVWWQYAGRGGGVVWCVGSMKVVVVVWCGVLAVCRSWWCDIVVWCGGSMQVVVVVWCGVVWWQYAGRGGGVM